MTVTAIVLILLSAVIHATWNLRSKQRYQSVPGFFVMTTLGMLCIMPILLFYLHRLPSVPSGVWWTLVATGFAQAAYYVGLAHAYRLNDISMAYPMARSLPVLMVPMVTLVLGQGEAVTPIAWAGMVLIVAGVIALPLNRLRDVHPRAYMSRGFLAVLLAAAGTTGYSVLDDHALRQLRATPGWDSISAPMVYVALEAMMSSLWLSLVALGTRQNRACVLSAVKADGVHATITGIMIFVAYGLVLAAMAFADNVGYVVAFRQLSVPITTIAGIVLLRESCYALRVIGMLLVTIGLGLVAIG